MKQNEIEELNKLKFTSLANIFNVYDDPNIGEYIKTYNINRTLNIIGLDNISNSYYDEYIVNDGDTWPLISYKVYGSIKLWWLIMKVNKKYNPTVSPIVGEVLKIISSGVVTEILKKIKSE